MTFAKLGLECPGVNHTNIISPVPPWYNISNLLFPFFSESTVGTMTTLEAQSSFKYLQDHLYPNYLEIFTDGSKTTDPEV